jgi:hypothetical protein
MTAITIEILEQRIPVLEQEATELLAKYHAALGQISEDRAWIDWLSEQARQASQETSTPGTPAGLEPSEGGDQ